MERKKGMRKKRREIEAERECEIDKERERKDEREREKVAPLLREKDDGTTAWRGVLTVAAVTRE